MAIVLAIVFGRKKSDDGGDNPPTPPIPPVPPIPKGYNPYYIETVSSDVASLKGSIVYNQTYNQAFFNQLQQPKVQEDKKIGVNAT